MSFFTEDRVNPWNQEPEFNASEAAASLIHLASQVEQAKPSCVPEELPAACHSLAGFIQADAQIYRQHRKMFLIKVLALQVAIEQVQQQGPEITADTEKLETHVCAASKELIALAKQVSSDQGTKKVSSALLGLQAAGVVAEVTVPSSSASLSSLSVQAFSAVQQRSVAAIALASHVGVSVLEKGVDVVTQPIAARANALRQALVDASGLALVGGILASVIFPPLAPVAVGLAYTSIGRNYAKHLDSSLTEAAQIQLLKKAGMREETARLMAQYRGEKVIRIETDHISAEIDVQTTALDATILSGRYCGKRLSDLASDVLELHQVYAPDEETRQIIERFSSQPLEEV